MVSTIKSDIHAYMIHTEDNVCAYLEANIYETLAEFLNVTLLYTNSPNLSPSARISMRQIEANHAADHDNNNKWSPRSYDAPESHVPPAKEHPERQSHHIPTAAIVIMH